MNMKLLKLKIMGSRSLLNSYRVAAFACAVYTFSTHCVKQFLHYKERSSKFGASTAVIRGDFTVHQDKVGRVTVIE